MDINLHIPKLMYISIYSIQALLWVYIYNKIMQYIFREPVMEFLDKPLFMNAYL